MNKLLDKIKFQVIKSKKIYLFLIIIFLIGLIFGSFFIVILNEEDKLMVINQIKFFFNKLKINEIDYLIALKNSISSNLIYIILIWLLGISVIGIPIIVFLVFMKGFIVGFSLSSIIATYKIIGILGSFTYIFPHIIISSFIIIIISCYALYLSFNILFSIIQRKSIDFKNIINRYCLIMLISTIVMIIASLIEVFISPHIIKLFLVFIK